MFLTFKYLYCRERDYDRDKDRYRVEKEGYKPNVRLDYVDEHGRQMTPKEVKGTDTGLCNIKTRNKDINK
jgi:hypothetical protein